MLKDYNKKDRMLDVQMSPLTIDPGDITLKRKD